jgi:hypothetical protein
VSLCACFRCCRGLHIGRPSSESSGNFVHSWSWSLVLGVLFPFACWFLDANFVECRVDRKSTSRTCQFLGSSLVSWSSRKQSSVAQSTTKAEYVVAASCCSQLL